MKKNLLPGGCLVLTVLALVGCRSLYYGTMEKFGVPKREIMVDRVKSAQASQSEAKEEFKSALEQFASVVKVEGGDLQKKYDKLSAAYEDAEAQAGEVRDRIDSIESVADALFDEWRGEIKQYSNAELRRASQQQYDATLAEYKQLMKTMNTAAKSMDPVLAAFKDQVMFLKHNLNARAIMGIRQEATRIESDVKQLITRMEASIAEADKFIRNMTAK